MDPERRRVVGGRAAVLSRTQSREYSRLHVNLARDFSFVVVVFVFSVHANVQLKMKIG